MPFFSNLRNPESHPTGGQSKIRTFFLYLTSFVVIVGGVSLLYFNFVGKTEAVWFDDSWSYRKAITITNHTSPENNVYLDLTGSNAVDTSTSTGIGNYIQSDCGDFRFSKQNGELLPYYLTTACNTSGTTGVHVFFDTFPAGAQTIYLYYGNPSAADGFSASDFSTAATGVTFGSYGSQLKGPSPVLYWKFNDGTGTTAQDSSVQNNDGTTNGPTWEPGGVSSGKGEFSLKFDGSNDLVSKTYSSDTELDPASSNMTVSAWVRHSSTAPGAATTDTVIARYSSGGYKLYINENGYYCFGVDDDASWGPDFSACSATAQGSYADSKWHFVEGVKDANSTITLYIDGKQITQTSLTSFGSISGSSPTFYVGIDSNGTSNPWDGLIDDVKVFTSEQSVRSAAQVKADYTARSTAEGASAVLGQDTSRTNLVNGLVGYWKLDETATPSIDSSGNGNSGTWVTSATNGTGKFGNGIVFNGTSGAINLQSPSVLDDLGPFTFSTWVYPNSAGESSLGRFFDKSNTLFFFNGSSSTIMFQIIYSTTNLQTATDNLITLGQWQHVTVTYDGSGNSSGIHIYKNGIEASTYGSSQNGSVSRTSDASNNLYIGNRAGDDRTFDGTMDDVRIYNRSLSPSEVRQLYNWTPGPIGYWKMDEASWTNNCSTDTVFDSSGNGYNGDACPASTGPTSPVTGKLGKAGNFDGTDDYVNTANITSLNSATQLSVSAWFYTDTLAGGDDNLRYIIAKEASGSTNAVFMVRLNTSTDQIEFYLGGSAYTGLTSGTISTNRWYHVEGTWDGTNVALYLDGIPVDTDTKSTATGSTTQEVRMGSVDVGSGPQRFWSGYIDDVRIYNYARTPAQIIEDMNAGHPAPGSPVGSPVGYWKLDEGYSTNVNDSTQNNNDLTMSSASWLTAGKFNKAWNGTGSVWIAQGADDDDFDFAAAGDSSISFWFKSDSDTNPASNAEYLIEKAAVFPSGAAGYTIYANTSGNIVYGIKDDGNWGASSPNTPEPDDTAISSNDIYDGTWHHIVATKTGTSRIDLYVDGKLNASDTTIAAIGSLANFESLFVGDDDGDLGNAFNGDIDELKIYRLALTADQVKIDLNRGQAVVYGALSTDPTLTPPVPDSYARSFCVPGDTTSCNPPVGEWNFEEGTGTNAYDTSTNANVGVLGTDGAGTDIPAWDSGKVGKSLRFDGSDDDVFVNDSASLAVNSVTYEAWVYPTGLTGTDFDILTEYFGGLHFTLTGSTGPAVNSIYVNYVDTGDNNHAYVGPANAITANQWNHVAFTRTGATQKGYVNGAEVTMTLSSGTNIGAGDTLDTSLLDVTIAERFSDILIYTGRLDQIKIFNYARSPAQIAWDYNRGKPIGYWKFDECQGTTANDSSGNSLSGTISAGAAGITSVGDCNTASTMWDNGESGKWNYSLDFDLTDDNVSVTNASRIDFNEGLQNGFTMAAWIYADSAGESNVGRIFDKGTNTYCRTDNPSGSNLDIECQLDLTSTDRNVNVSSAVTTAAWNHVAFVWNNDSDDDVRVYINGRSRGVSSTNSNDTIPADTNNFTIGNNSAGSATFDGKIDDVRIYNYEMTANQIKTLFNQDSTVRYGPATGAP